MNEDVFIHPTALVETSRIGADTRIWAFSHVLAGASVGERCNIGDHCFVESNAVIGHDVTIKNGNAIWDGVVLQDGVFVAPGVVFTNDRNPRSPRLADVGARYADSGWLVPTLVCRGATLGAGAVILAGVTIGEFAFVAAGALVTKDVPPFALALGRPATVRGSVCRCGQRIDFGEKKAHCGACGRAYRLSEGAVVAEDA